MPSAGAPAFLVWRLRDEERVMRSIKNERAFQRYVSCSLARRLDFDGKPTTPEWEVQFLERVRYARRDRKVPA